MQREEPESLQTTLQLSGFDSRCSHENACAQPRYALQSDKEKPPAQETKTAKMTNLHSNQ